MEDEDLIQLSALQHYLYCPRQCGLIHLEQAWAENRQTAEGRLLHERADQPLTEQRHGIRTATAMPLICHRLGISGIADVVEFRESDTDEQIFPVEYKRGKPKKHRADEVQLCAQALCLEEMFGRDVLEGALFYGKTRRRQAVEFDSSLRELTIEVIQSTRRMMKSGSTPTAEYSSGRCDACSLIELCQPHLLGVKSKVNAWLLKQLKE